MPQNNDDLVMKTLLEIKEDIGGLSSDMQSVKGSLSKNSADHETVQGQIRKMESTVNLIPGHIQSVKDMEIRLDDRIGKIEADVRSIKEIELPSIKDQMVVQKWFASKWNKIFALIGVGLLGAAGSYAGGLIKDNVKVTITHPEEKSPVVPAPTMDIMSNQPADAVDLDADVTP